MKNRGFKLMTCLLFCLLAGHAHAQNDKYRAMVVKSANTLGPAGYAKCAAASLVMNALKARGDNLGRFKDQVDPFSSFMGDVRNTLIAKGTPSNSLDQLLRASHNAIMADQDPVLRGMKDFDKCYNDAVS